MSYNNYGNYGPANGLDAPGENKGPKVTVREVGNHPLSNSSSIDAGRSTQTESTSSYRSALLASPTLCAAPCSPKSLPSPSTLLTSTRIPPSSLTSSWLTDSV